MLPERKRPLYVRRLGGYERVGVNAKDNIFSKNNGNPVRYWGKPYDTMIPGIPINA
jgi:hypothetical protein